MYFMYFCFSGALFAVYAEQNINRTKTLHLI